MTDLFDYAAAREAKRDGMERVELNADERWKLLMEQLVIQVARQKQFFTSDDVFDVYDALPEKPETHDQRAFGPVMMRAARSNVCRKANLPHRMSNRPSLHASPRQVWESLIFEMPT